MINIAVFISGRGSNFIKIHENIKSNFIKNATISVVFSNNENAKGLEYAKNENIPVVIIPSKNRSDRENYDAEIIEAIKPYSIDLICLAGYMRIVTNKLINEYKNKIINIHPALLPSFTGLDAQKQAIEYGVRYSGCTVHFVDTGVDTGPIILQSVVEVSKDDTEETLSAKILKEEHIIYSKAINLFAENKLSINGRKVEIKN